MLHVSLVAPARGNGRDDDNYDDDDDGDSALAQHYSCTAYTVPSNIRPPVATDITYTAPSDQPSMTYTVPDIKFTSSDGSNENCKTQ